MFVWVYCSEILCERQRKHVEICPLFWIGQGRMPSRMRGDACGYFFHFFLFAPVCAANIFALRSSNFRAASIFPSAIISISNFPKPIINDFKFSKTDHDQTFRNGSDQNQCTNRSGSGDADQISDQIRSVWIELIVDQFVLRKKCEKWKWVVNHITTSSQRIDFN